MEVDNEDVLFDDDDNTMSRVWDKEDKGEGSDEGRRGSDVDGRGKGTKRSKMEILP